MRLVWAVLSTPAALLPTCQHIESANQQLRFGQRREIAMKLSRKKRHRRPPVVRPFQHHEAGARERVDDRLRAKTVGVEPRRRKQARLPDGSRKPKRVET